MAPINSILPRQSTGDNCPSTIGGGAIAGIVLGSIAGTLLLLWLWRVCRTPGTWSGGEPDVGYRPPIVRSSVSTRGRKKRRRGPGTYVEYAEKPIRTSSRRSRDDNVRRPSRVYMTEA